MFTFVCLGARDLARATQFYDVTMATLGHARCNVGAEPEWVGWVGWGTYEHWGARELALWVCSPFDGQPATVGNGTPTSNAVLHSSGDYSHFISIALKQGHYSGESFAWHGRSDR